ncbi:MAG: TonB-dependent receptor plug domain-containing protein [Ramlibacter sp.]|nr:TonB-dependent receptor [Ramlibacter sp.]
MKLPHYRALLIHTGTVALAACSFAAAAQTQLAASNLVDLSLEQLANIEVVSVSKRPQRLADVAATTYVISAEDIRRSGATSVPEALRLAPNLQVARADANQYAVTARGFNSVLANKMLVLVDGRTVYSPLFSGVFWEAQDVMLEDVERIEVLSGPGGTLYGANAVQGVINIITRSSVDTHGALVAAGGGNKDSLVAARYGDVTASGTSYRLWARHVRRENSELTNGTAVRDESKMSHGGFRADRREARDLFTVQGDLYDTRIDQAPSERRVSGFNLLGRWSRDLDGGARSQLQAYFDRAERDQPGSLRDSLDTWDIEYQQLSRPHAGHELIWGGGYRHHNDKVTNTNPAVLALIPAQRQLNLWNVFAQDEVALRPDLKLTLGLKAEHNDYTGLEWLPNARMAWELRPGHLMWGAASRTVRTPSRLDVEFFQPGTAPFLIAGGPRFVSEVARVYELGYRGQPTPAISYSVSVFHHDYERLRSVDIAPGGATFNNNFEGRMHGLTTWGTWRANDHLRFNASYAYQDQHFHALAGTAPLGGIASLGNDPKQRWTLGSSLDFAANMELDLQLRYMGSLPNPAVPSYAALDVRWGWRVRPDLEISITARNLGDPGHPEWGSALNRAEFERSVFVKAVWRQ